MSSEDYPAGPPSALSVLGKISLVNRNAFDQIEKAFDEAIAKEVARKRTIVDVFRSKAFWNGFRDGLAAPLFLLESYTSRHPRSRPQHQPALHTERDALRWAVIGRYCADNPEIVTRVDLTDAERQKLDSLMVAPLKARGEDYAFKAG